MGRPAKSIYSNILFQDVLPRDLTAILDFMYHGEVNVKQDHLNSFLAVAEKLRVRGLCQSDSNNSSSGAKLPSSHNSEKPKISRPHDNSSFSESSSKKARSSHVQESHDDDIEEIPQVKQEVHQEASGSRVAASVSRGEDYQMADAYDDSLQSGEYGEEYYDDDMGYGDQGAMVDPSQAKGKNHHEYCSSSSHCIALFSLVVNEE